MNRLKIRIYFSVLTLFLLLTTGCESETLLNKEAYSAWYEEFRADIKDKKMQNIHEITVQTGEPNTAGFRLLILTLDQLHGVKWPKTYIIPFSTDENGKAEILLDYFFPELQLKTINVFDIKIYHPILYFEGSKEYLKIADNHFEVKQTNWIDPYSNPKPEIKPDLDKPITAYSFYEYAGRILNLKGKLIPYNLSVLTGEESYLAYLASDEDMGKYGSIVLDMNIEDNQLITKAQAVAFLVRLYGFDSFNVNSEENEYENEWQIARELGFINDSQVVPENTVLQGDEALIIINDWAEKFSFLENSKEETIKLLTKEEINELYTYGLADDQINLMGYQAVKTLLELFSTEIIIDKERKIVIDSFIKQKCAPIERINTYFCPDGNKTIFRLP